MADDRHLPAARFPHRLAGAPVLARSRVLTAVLAAAVVTAACALGVTVASSTTVTAAVSPDRTALFPSGSTTMVPPGAVDKVLVFIEENHSLDEMKTGMPYLYSQAQMYGYAANYTAISHPSLPNYLAVAFGSTFGVARDTPPSRRPDLELGLDVFTAAVQAGRTARSYQESMTSNCALTDQGRYAVRHNPWAYGTTTAARSACSLNDVPSGSSTSGQLHDDIVSGVLPNVGEVTPDLDNDAHDGTLLTADNWLKDWLTLIYASPDWNSGHLAVIVTADEDAHNQDNMVLTTVIHPSQSAHVVTTALTHYSLSEFLTEVGHAVCIGSGCDAPSFATAFGLSIA